MTPRHAVVRLFVILGVLVRHFLAGLGPTCLRRDPAPLAAALRRALETLGPAFVKLGQFLSVRPDLLPAGVLRELEHLQDRAAPVATANVAAVLEAELGAPLRQLFREFDPQPVAAASLSQVHRAVLPSGEIAAVKVQRPGAEAVLRHDLRLARPLVRAVVAATPLRHRIDVKSLWQEVEAAAARELDFRHEAEVAESMARAFRSVPGIRIPRVHWSWTTRRVLTTDFVDGVKISDPAARSRADYQELAERGARAFLKQVLEDGLFHADLHPANLLITPAGEIAYLDFGIAGRLGAGERRAILGALTGLVTRDPELAFRHLETLGVRVPERSREEFVREVATVMEQALGRSLGELSVGRIGWGILAAVHRHGVAFPRRHVLLLKALMTVEGSARLLHPWFSFEAAARRYLADRTRRALSLSGLAEASWRAAALLGLAALLPAPVPTPNTPATSGVTQ